MSHKRRVFIALNNRILCQRNVFQQRRKQKIVEKKIICKKNRVETEWLPLIRYIKLIQSEKKSNCNARKAK